MYCSTSSKRNVIRVINCLCIYGDLEFFSALMITIGSGLQCNVAKENISCHGICDLAKTVTISVNQPMPETKEKCLSIQSFLKLNGFKCKGLILEKVGKNTNKNGLLKSKVE